MPKPKTSPELSPQPYRLLKSDLAAKLSPRSEGGIAYVLMADMTESPELHIAVTENVGGGGLWSKEAVSLTGIEAVIDTYEGAAFPTKALRSAMAGRSSNNPPFLLAVLKDLGLVVPSEKPHQHVKSGDWMAFRTEWLHQPGNPVMYPETTGADEPPAAEALPPQKGKKRRKAVSEAVEEKPSERSPSDEAEHAPAEVL